MPRHLRVKPTGLGDRLKVGGMGRREGGVQPEHPGKGEQSIWAGGASHRVALIQNEFEGPLRHGGP